MSSKSPFKISISPFNLHIGNNFLYGILPGELFSFLINAIQINYITKVVQ